MQGRRMESTNKTPQVPQGRIVIKCSRKLLEQRTHELIQLFNEPFISFPHEPPDALHHLGWAYDRRETVHALLYRVAYAETDTDFFTVKSQISRYLPNERLVPVWNSEKRKYEKIAEKVRSSDEVFYESYGWMFVLLVDFLCGPDRDKLKPCDHHCGNLIITTRTGPNKTFCSDPCRVNYHNRESITSGKKKVYMKEYRQLLKKRTSHKSNRPPND